VKEFIIDPDKKERVVSFGISVAPELSLGSSELTSWNLWKTYEGQRCRGKLRFKRHLQQNKQNKTTLPKKKYRCHEVAVVIKDGSMMFDFGNLAM
jgi:hypothetical protein